MLRITASKYITTEPDGTVVTFFEGYSNNDDRQNLPKAGTCHGSNVIEVDSGDWLFFDEEAQEWLPKVNIEG